MRRPEKFVGLHAHSGFSTFDGLSYPQDHIDYVRQNNMTAWALTDHGHMNGFAHAYLHAQKLNKAGANFKFIPGCEMYVHPDLDVWRLDYEIKQAAKRGDTSALKMLREEREKIQTPLVAITDGDDEIVDIAVDSAGQTVENEEETKSGKFFDPIKRRHHLVVLPRTSVGLERLFGLVSRGYSEGFYRFPRVDYKMIKEASKGGHLMISTACLGGPLSYEVFRQIQGVEFDDLNQNLLDEHLHKLEEAKKRDHRKLGKELELFFFSENVGAGLPIWLPNGHIVRENLIEFMRKEQIKQGYKHVTSPHIGSKNLYVTSGHYDKYGESSFQPIQVPSDNEEYLLKPMNCPHHCEIFKFKPHSYKELPVRIAEFGTVYRYEQSGELHGMTRVRGFTQDDAHIFCSIDQVGDEVLGVIDLILKVFKSLSFKDYKVQISLRDENDSSKYIGESSLWDRAENDLIEAVKRKKIQA